MEKEEGRHIIFGGPTAGGAGAAPAARKRIIERGTSNVLA